MIVDALIRVGQFLALTVLGILPESSVALDLPASSDLTAFLSDRLGPFDRFAPLHESLDAIMFVLVFLLPPIIAYRIATWVYAHIPLIGRGS